MDIQKLLEYHQRAIGELYVGNMILQDQLAQAQAKIADLTRPEPEPSPESEESKPEEPKAE